MLTYQGVAVWRHTKIIQWALQIVSGILVVVLVAWFFTNIVNAVQDREIPHGWNFLDRAYQTPIGQHFLPYESSDSFAYALGVAAVNTLVVSVVGVILATALGIFIGVARLSTNWMVSKLAMVYIEFFRNVPLLVQLFFWFYIILALPPVREGYIIGEGLFINNGGMSMPFPQAAGLGPVFGVGPAGGRVSRGGPGRVPVFAGTGGPHRPGVLSPDGRGGRGGVAGRHNLDCDQPGLR